MDVVEAGSSVFVCGVLARACAGKPADARCVVVYDFVQRHWLRR